MVEPVFYNTMTRRKERFVPLEPGRALIYSCGPTVYRYVHVGNLRTFLFADLLCRSLEYLGFDVRQVMNITDVGHLTEDDFDRGEDKMLVQSRLEKKTPEEIAEYYTAAFMEDALRLNIRPAAEYPRATHYIARMQEIIRRLIDSGHAYVADGTVYFDIASFPEYGALSGNRTEDLLAGVRGDPDPRKRHPGDFTLWKRAGDRRLQAWDSPWGRGYPGWHIECSAMSTALLGERFDVHTGGADNVFPHHEAEIAQSECAFGHRVVGYWMHGEHLLMKGARMAKSAGNFVRVSELPDPLAFRYLCLQARYRTKLNFSDDSLEGSGRALKSLRARVPAVSASPSLGPEATAYEERFVAAIADDLDLPAAVVTLNELLKSDLPDAEKRALVERWDAVFGLDLTAAPEAESLPDGAQALLDSRAAARAAKDWPEADRLRTELAALGVRVKDGPDGQSWELA